MNKAIIFEGDYVRYSGGYFRVNIIADYDSDGDANLYLSNGSIVNSAKITTNDVKSEAEIFA
jgi:hypothetical protein